MGEPFPGERLAAQDGLYAIDSQGAEVRVQRHDWWQRQADAIRGEEVITVSTLDEIAALGGDE